MTLIEYNSITMNSMCFFSILLCIGGFWNLLSSIRLRHHKYSLASLIQLLLSYLVFCETTDIIKHDFKGFSAKYFEVLSETDGKVWVIMLCLLLVVFLCVYLLNRLWNKNHVTFKSIRECGDIIPEGICYWRNSGKIMFLNSTMMDLCHFITGKALLNGNAFYDALSEQIIMLDDGTVWQFKHREFEFKGKPVHELIASNITEVYRKTQRLRDDVKKAQELSDSLSEYNKNIDELVRNQEILQAKVNVHDEMNRIILAASATIGEEIDTKERNEVLNMWEQNTLFLARDARKENFREIKNDLDKTAHLLGLNLIWNDNGGNIGSGELSVLKTIAGEAMANAVKHANAENLWIDISIAGGMTRILFENDGILPEAEIVEGGGMANLRSLAENMGGTIETEVSDRFRLYVILKREN